MGILEWGIYGRGSYGKMSYCFVGIYSKKKHWSSGKYTLSDHHMTMGFKKLVFRGVPFPVITSQWGEEGRVEREEGLQVCCCIGVIINIFTKVGILIEVVATTPDLV